MLKEKCRDAFNLPLPPSLFLFIGRYHPWKGVRELVEAARHFPDDLFVFAGTGTLPDRPRNCIDIGSVPFERVPLLINAADCLILPSHTEGVPNVLMESLACGVPVVSSDVGGCPEVVTDGATGLLVPPGDVPALVRAVRWMKDHPDERVVMGQRGREDIAMRYEQRILLDRLIAIHTGLIGD
ncbi:MAG: glycosyltransferase family 4 protein, partial [Methanomicrobiaceae archaeon]|nr:glycosyltransferase family 4 protein [Methanomicrobiaceae archaeon]